MNVSIVSTATHFVVTGLSGSATAGAPLTITVTALDAYNNVALLYTGTVQFSTTDPSLAAILPSTYTFTSGDAGVHVFTGLVKLVTDGEQTVTATDSVTHTITGTSGDVDITSATSSQLVVTTEPSTTATAGLTFATQPVVKLEDQYGNVITTDSTDTVTVASDGTAFIQGSPLTVTLSGGVATFTGLSYDKAETMHLGFATSAPVVSAGSPATSPFPRPPAINSR